MGRRCRGWGAVLPCWLLACADQSRAAVGDTGNEGGGRKPLFSPATGRVALNERKKRPVAVFLQFQGQGLQNPVAHENINT